MNRYIAIPEEEILSDPEAAGGILLRAAERKDRLFFQALIPLGETLLFCFEDRMRKENDPVVRRFFFSPFRTQSAEEAAAAVNARAAAGETLLAAFYIDTHLWGFYAEFQQS